MCVCVCVLHLEDALDAMSPEDINIELLVVERRTAELRVTITFMKLTHATLTNSLLNPSEIELDESRLNTVK